MKSGIDAAITAAGGGPEGVKALADLLGGVSVQFIYNSRRKGWFPVDRARVIAERFDLPLADLVREDIRQALLNA